METFPKVRQFPRTIGWDRPKQEQSTTVSLMNPCLGERAPLLTVADTQVGKKKLTKNLNEFDGSGAQRFHHQEPLIKPLA